MLDQCEEVVLVPVTRRQARNIQTMLTTLIEHHLLPFDLYCDPSFLPIHEIVAVASGGGIKADPSVRTVKPKYERKPVNHQAILSAMADGCTTCQQIKAHSGESQPRVNNALIYLRRKGLVVNPLHNTWVLVDRE